MIIRFDGFEINPVHAGDAWKICDLIVSNQERLKTYFPKTLEQNLTPTLSQLFVEKKIKAFHNNTEFLFTIKESATRKLVGLCYLKELDWDKKQGEFAYCIDYNFEGKGITKKVIQKLSEYALGILKLEILQIITHKNNIGSVKIALANNFKWVKTLKEGFTPPGGNPLDMELYELRSTT